jgi:hypothetical protein
MIESVFLSYFLRAVLMGLQLVCFILAYYWGQNFAYHLTAEDSKGKIISNGVKAIVCAVIFSSCYFAIGYLGGY